MRQSFLLAMDGANKDLDHKQNDCRQQLFIVDSLHINVHIL